MVVNRCRDDRRARRVETNASCLVAEDDRDAPLGELPGRVRGLLGEDRQADAEEAAGAAVFDLAAQQTRKVPEFQHFVQ